MLNFSTTHRLKKTFFCLRSKKEVFLTRSKTSSLNTSPQVRKNDFSDRRY